jgi:putative ABC transport system permease protein
MIFIAVVSVHASLMQTLQDALKYWNYDIGVSFDRSYRIEKIEAAAYQVPNVAAVECWGMSPTRRLRVDGTASKELLLVAPGAETKMLQPVLLQGRWLDSQDENALVINTDLLKEEPDLRVGQEVVLELNGHKTPWRIVGVVQGVMSGATAYANYPHFARVAGDTGRASGTQVITTQHDPEFQAHVSKALEDRFRIDGINVLGAETVSDVRQRVRQQFDLIVIFLLVMALLLVAVGGLGLMGTMSLNVLERTREIGVLRAIGASDSSLTLIILSEGLTIGALSWLAAVAAAVPLSMLLSQAVGGLLLGSALSYTYSLAGAVAWLVVVILTASLASVGPARRACKLTVREVLAYE